MTKTHKSFNTKALLLQQEPFKQSLILRNLCVFSKTHAVSLLLVSNT